MPKYFQEPWNLVYSGLMLEISILKQSVTFDIIEESDSTANVLYQNGVQF